MQRKISEFLERTGARPHQQGDDKENYEQERLQGEDGRALRATFLLSVRHPLEGIKILRCLMVSMMRSPRDKSLGMLFWDLSRSHLRNSAT